MKLLRKISALFRKEKLDAEMTEEMRLQLERRVEENTASGMSGDETRYAALRKFGGVEQAKEIAREQRGWIWLEHVARDFRFSLRSLWRARGFSGAVIATLALCIGANTAIFSTLYSMLLRPLPFRDAGRVVEIHAVDQAARRAAALDDASGTRVGFGGRGNLRDARV